MLTTPHPQIDASNHHKGIVAQLFSVSLTAMNDNDWAKATGISGMGTWKINGSICGRKGIIQPAAISSQTLYIHFAAYRFDKMGRTAVYTSVINDIETEH